jgi:hypothetical protein
MSELYSSLPPESYSLNDYIRLAKSLEREDNSAFLRFVLTGESPEGHQVVVDPIRNLLDERHPVRTTRDYDSVIGLTTDIVVDCMISVYPIPNPAQVLTTSIHIKYPIVNGNVSQTVTYIA